MMNRSKRVLGLILVLALVFVSFVGCGSKEKIVATVNGEDITKAEFDITFDSFKMQYEQQFGPDVWEQDMEGRKFIDVAKERILEVEIGYILEAKKAKDLGVSVTDAELQTEVDNAKTYFGDEAKFNEFLTTQKMTLETFKESMGKQMLSVKLKDKINENTAVTDQEIEAYYNANKAQFNKASASHILLKTIDEAKAAKVRALAGEDFSALAKELSTDPSAQSNGGDLGSFAYTDMVEPFAKAAFAMKAGDISEPVKTDYGFHIIKSAGVKQATFAESKETISVNLLEAKKNETYAKLMKELTDAADIKKFPENMTTTK